MESSKNVLQDKKFPLVMNEILISGKNTLIISKAGHLLFIV